MTLLGGILAAFMLFGCFDAQAGTTRLQAVLEAVVARYHLPGAVVLVSAPGGVESATTGIADLASGIPVTEETRFHIASVGKMLTAVAILQLIDEKKLSLDDPILPFLDSDAAGRFASVKTATVAQLLSHTSGLPDCLRNGSFSIPEHPGITWVASEVFRQGRCLGPTTPGIYSYSNTNYIILGYILEKIEKEDLSAILTRRILRPLAMTNSAVVVNAEDPRLAHGYFPSKTGGKPRDGSLLAWSSHLGDAPLTTTAADLALFFKALFGSEGRLLSPEMRAAMTSEWGKDEDEAYGFGLELVSTDVGPRYGHNGRFAGFCAEAWYYPTKDTIVILLGNGDEHSPEDVMDIVEASLFPSAQSGP